MGELLMPTGSTGVPLELHVSRPGTGGVGSLTPVVQIRNATTNNSYLDFADNTFKTAGWTTKQSSLAAIPGETGRYRFLWNSSLAAAVVDGFRSAAEYIVTGTNALIAYDSVIFRTEAAGGGGPTAGQIADAVWDETMADHLTGGTTGAKLNSAGGVQGDGSVTVSTNYPTTNNLQAVDSLGAGIDNVVIRAFLTTDYTAGNRADAFVKGRTTTDVNGFLFAPLFLDPAAYTLVYEKQGPPGQGYGPNTKTLTVT